MFGWLMLFLFFIMIISYIIYNWFKDSYCSFLYEIPFIGDFLFTHDIIFFIVSFWITVMPIIGAGWSFIKMCNLL
jgi:hypothetical protein